MRDLNVIYTCPICQNISSRVWLCNCLDLLCRCPGEWELRECSRCRVIFTSPPIRDHELSQYYPVKYHVYNPPLPLRDNRSGRCLRYLATLPYRLRFGNPDWIGRPFGSGKLLDIGCGAGRFLKQAVELGWQGWGLDLSPYAVQETRRYVPQAIVFQCTLDEFNAQETFAAISMNHVLEHVPDPMATLQRCFNLLSPGGKLYISVPNIDSWEARLFGRDWVGLDVPRHLTHFPEEVLKRLLSDIGFSVQTRPAMFASFISESLILMLPESLRYQVFYSKLARFLYLLAIFPASVTYLIGNRGVVEFLAQKPDCIQR
jgi:2-polyprenyl-3-methyl-5-hydroxy-6-metoxy-1,4-benzoquinol methylase